MYIVSAFDNNELAENEYMQAGVFYKKTLRHSTLTHQRQFVKVLKLPQGDVISITPTCIHVHTILILC